MRRLFLSLVIVAMFAAISLALPGTAQYKASWLANTETDLAGYYLYWRAVGGQFSDANKISCAKTATSQLLNGIVPNKSEIALTAYDTAGNESEYSTIIPFDQDAQAPVAPGGLKIEKVI